ncbi:Stealth-CR2 multi-domain protein [Pyrenophora tritici-repentis]|nr:Stealth-CR2 multi-domain protein [Pyrenophora tritici-repentis]KAI1687003.1 Stealth-CR2 multi-domain protein [Pyrenophora tritici-repentis]
MIVVSIEESVQDVVLEGWEDTWVAKARYQGPHLPEPKIDFVYNWVNGSQPELIATMRPYDINSSLNDEEGIWLAVELYAGTFLNRVQILVNAYEKSPTDGSAVGKMGKQSPYWLRGDAHQVQVLSQEEFFGPEERKCLPTFDSLTIENQLYNTKSDTGRLFALSDDMILGKPHSASDLYSPLFGPTLGFKDNTYNTLSPPTEKDAERFGEKPFLIYISWLLNRRFGARKRKGQVHFGHSLSQVVMREAITSFPGPAFRSAAQRFRGETDFQIYSWNIAFHYAVERHREALLYTAEEGMNNEPPEQYRRRIYYNVSDHLEEAGLQPPKVNTEIVWTSLDGPIMIKDLDCDTFDAEECLAPGFSTQSADAQARSPVFSTAAIFGRVSREYPRCGDCLIKLVLNRRRCGLGPLLPHFAKKPHQREVIVKALMKYQYTIVQPDAAFHMVTDAQQAEHTLLRPYIKHNKKVGEMCLNDDVLTQDEGELEAVRMVMGQLFEGLFPNKSSFEL